MPKNNKEVIQFPQIKVPLGRAVEAMNILAKLAGADYAARDSYHICRLFKRLHQHPDVQSAGFLDGEYRRVPHRLVGNAEVIQEGKKVFGRSSRHAARYRP